MNILFVDADLNVLRGLVRSVQLEDESWQAAVAFDAESASSLLHRYAFDAVITDWPISTPNDRDVLAHFAEICPHCPCIVLAANLSDEQKMELQEANVHFLPKPTPWDQIRTTIQNAVSLRESKSVHPPNHKESLPTNHLHEILKPRRKPAILNRVQREAL